MLSLPGDTIFVICNNLNFTDILTLSHTTRFINELLDKKFYINLAYKIYHRYLTLNYLNNMDKIEVKFELLRLQNFQRRLDNLNNSRWTNKDFYNYWKYERFNSINLSN